MLHTHYPLLDSSCVFLLEPTGKCCLPSKEEEERKEKKKEKTIHTNTTQTEIGSLILSTYCILQRNKCANEMNLSSRKFKLLPGLQGPGPHNDLLLSHHWDHFKEVLKGQREKNYPANRPVNLLFFFNSPLRLKSWHFWWRAAVNLWDITLGMLGGPLKTLDGIYVQLPQKNNKKNNTRGLWYFLQIEGCNKERHLYHVQGCREFQCSGCNSLRTKMSDAATTAQSFLTVFISTFVTFTPLQFE